MENEFKVYTAISKLSDDYYALTYYLFRNNEIVSHGVEDFSHDRLKSCVKCYEIKLLTGKEVVTTTGLVRRTKDTLSCVVAVSSSAKKTNVLQLVKSEFGNSVEIVKTYTRYFYYESFDKTIKNMLSHIFSKDTDSKDTDSKDTDSKDTDSKDTDSKDTDSKDTFNMECEYFFSLSSKLPCKCKYCIYSKRDFCPADGERYWGICEE